MTGSVPTVTLRRDDGTLAGVCSAELDSRLAEAFARVGDRWRERAHDWNADESAILAHTPSAAPNNSDFGAMLAWTEVVRECVERGEQATLRIDDPWLFRHFAALSGVHAADPVPPLITRVLILGMRGWVTRCVAAVRCAWAAFTTRRGPLKTGAPTLLVYGHPASTADGRDAYFGDLMVRFPRLRRVLHVDARPAAAHRLHDDPRTDSLHGWGSPLYALMRLPFVRWRPSPRERGGSDRWLVRRAAAFEGATGQAAEIAWQLHCQSRWLRAARPSAVIWPWENHGWERALTREARSLGIPTIGHQHSVIGQQFNIGAIDSDAIPDIVAANGPSGRDQLIRRAVPAERIVVAGTLRFKPAKGPAHDPSGPVFVAVPFDRAVAAQMIEALRPLSERGIEVRIRDHPLFPVEFKESPTLRRADGPLQAQASVRAVLYAATTVGLEALLAGLPVVRFVPRGRIALDVMPDAGLVPDAGPDDVDRVLERAGTPAELRWSDVFATPDFEFWRRHLD